MEEARAVSRFGYALFETPIGLCAIVWSARFILGTQLPEPGRGAAMRRLQRRFPDAHSGPPTPAVAPAMARIRGGLRGAQDDFPDLPLHRPTLSAVDPADYPG